MNGSSPFTSGYLLRPPRRLRDACAEIRRLRGRGEPRCCDCALADFCICPADDAEPEENPPALETAA